MRVQVGRFHLRDYPVQEGSPRRSGNSYTCFMIVISIITNYIEDDILCTLYVDDVTIYSSGTRGLYAKTDGHGRVHSGQRAIQIIVDKLRALIVF